MTVIARLSPGATIAAGVGGTAIAWLSAREQRMARGSTSSSAGRLL